MHKVDPVKSRIVLIGAAYHRDEELPAVPQVAANVADLASIFTDPRIGGYPIEHCIVSPERASVEDVGDLLHDAAEQAEDLLLFYYSGHGVIGRGGELYLSLYNTRFHLPEYSALRFETVRGTFLDSAATSKIVIIDSCYSGRAIGSTLAGGYPALQQLEITGTYTLTSAPPNSVALVRAGERHTAFTGRLLALLREGIPHAGNLLSMGEIYQGLYARLRADGLPPPQQRGTATADLLGLVRNLNHSAPTSTRGRALLLLDEIEPLITTHQVPVAQNHYFVRLARLLAATDLDRALRVTDTMSGIGQAQAVAGVARVVAITDTARAADLFSRAEDIAVKLTRATAFVQATAQVAFELADFDPDHAADLFELAERRSKAIDRPTQWNRTLGTIMTAIEAIAPKLAVLDPMRAEHLTNGNPDEVSKAGTLAEIGRAVAGLDPECAARLFDRAEGLTDDLTYDYAKAFALTRIGHAMAAVDPDRAADVIDRAMGHAQALTRQGDKMRMFAGIARAWAGIDPSRAERIASLVVQKIPKPGGQDIYYGVEFAQYSSGAYSLPSIVAALAVSDPDRAERITALISHDALKALALAALAKSLVLSERERASGLLDQAERLISGLPNRASWEPAMLKIAWAQADLNPDRAEQIARGIPDDGYRMQACLVLASIWLNLPDEM